jgi:putative nucleotidyltransferase with HDIG domain
LASVNFSALGMASAVDAASKSPAEHGPARVLVLESDPGTRSAIADALESKGHRVQFAGSAADALQAHAASGFDLMLTDLALDDKDSLSLLEQLHNTHPHLPILIVTSINDLDVALCALRSGAADYLLKPIIREDLQEAVERALNRLHAVKESHLHRENLEQEVRSRTAMLQKAMEELEHSYDVTLEALGDALDMKDSETEGHSKRVTAYTVTLARAIGLSPAQIKMIARGAFLHDIGKMAIPDQILRKPGKLAANEQVAMREHCTLGYQMLRKIPFLAESAEIVYAHQERYDGCGYPRGLRGEEIPIGARIFSVADTLDAITSDRSYRKGASFDEARAEILRCAETQFDPRIVEVFLTIPSELWHELRSEIMGREMRFSTFELANALEAELLGISGGRLGNEKID